MFWVYVESTWKSGREIEVSTLQLYQ